MNVGLEWPIQWEIKFKMVMETCDLNYWKNPWKSYWWNSNQNLKTLAMFLNMQIVNLKTNWSFDMATYVTLLKIH